MEYVSATWQFLFQCFPTFERKSNSTSSPAVSLSRFLFAAHLRFPFRRKANKRRFRQVNMFFIHGNDFALRHFPSKISSFAYLGVCSLRRSARTKKHEFGAERAVSSRYVHFVVQTNGNGRLEHLFSPRLNHLLTQLICARASASAHRDSSH